MTALERSDLIVAWAIIALGTIHVLATPVFVPEFGEPVLWFVSGGGAFILVGIMNLVTAMNYRAVPSLLRV